jgi:hypothetical protein
MATNYGWEQELGALAALSDEEAAAAIIAMTVAESYSRFGSFRTLAGLLTAAEYGALRAGLTAAAGLDPRIPDMIDMLELPGDEGGNGGGIDFSVADVQGLLATVLPGDDWAAARAKIAAYPTRQVPKYTQGCSNGQVKSAREQANGQ